MAGRQQCSCEECDWHGDELDLVNRWDDVKNYVYCPDCKGSKIDYDHEEK